MSWRSRWWIVALVAGAILVGTGPLYITRFSLPGYGFVPLAIAGLAAASSLGMQRVASASRWLRWRNGCLWAVIWIAILPVPAVVRSGLFLWAAHAAPAPAGSVYVIAPGDDIEFGLLGGLLGTGGSWRCGGYQVLWRSNLTANEIEQYYRKTLTGRGWRLQWNRNVGGAGRMLCFRRADGFLVLRIVDVAEKNVFFGLVYDHLASPRRYR